MHAKFATLAVGKKSLQGFFDRAKGKIIPGNFMLCKQEGFHGFMPWRKLIGGQFSAEKEMHLSHPGHIEHCEKPLHLKLGPSLFSGFSCGTFTQGLTQLHETGG